MEVGVLGCLYWVFLGFIVAIHARLPRAAKVPLAMMLAVGVVVDATREILRVDPNIVEPAPALLTRGDGDAEIASICRLEEGQRLVALLSPDRLFRPELVRRILAEQASAGETELQSEANVMSDEQFIIFRLGDQDYGIPIAAVPVRTAFATRSGPELVGALKRMAATELAYALLMTLGLLLS